MATFYVLYEFLVFEILRDFFHQQFIDMYASHVRCSRCTLSWEIQKVIFQQHYS